MIGAQMGSLLFVGCSHVAAFARAGESLKRENPGSKRILAVHLQNPKYLPQIVERATGFGLSDAMEELLTRHMKQGARIVSCAGGNRHNIIGLMRHPCPFDFVLPERPDLPITPDCQLVPSSLIEDFMRRDTRAEKTMLGALKATAPDLVHIESPPPVRDDSFILENADQYFRSRDIQGTGVTPAWIRYKLWKTYSKVIRGYCTELGIGFMPTPQTVMDESGFLLPDARIDATHGNEWYAGKIVHYLEGVMFGEAK
ncbi:hypothetical protein CSC74_02560 [Pseudoxanthomonas yeongjuensis]|nr:hypothetical protein CSC74_02560 [Pseudoxanthomonas yeongjuensis]